MFCLAGALLLAGIAPWSQIIAQQPRSQATVRLRPQAIANGTQVRLGDVADIFDRDLSRRTKLQNLDLAILNGSDDTTLNADLVQIRILLAGFDRDAVLVTGETQVLVSPPRAVNLTDLGVEQAVLEALCRQFAVPEDELAVKLATPFVGNLPSDVLAIESPRLDVLRSTQLPLGRNLLTIRILDGERVAAAKPAMFNITRRQHVLVAATSMERASVITAAHLQEEVRYLETPTDRLLPHQLIGRRITMAVRPGEILSVRHIGDVAEDEEPILVHARDPVRLIARKGRLTVTIPVAEAMQSGRKGQLIRVRNLQSNQVVTGQVVSSGEVRVLMP
jgi:flagella basal body P-ring formation protein FlgA